MPHPRSEEPPSDGNDRNYCHRIATKQDKHKRGETRENYCSSQDVYVLVS